MNVDFNTLFREQAEKFHGAKLLLHCCCAPCASSCLERLKDYFKITVLFYNPNIDGTEYDRRKAELIKFINATGWRTGRRIFIPPPRDSKAKKRAAHAVRNALSCG